MMGIDIKTGIPSLDELIDINLGELTVVASSEWWRNQTFVYSLSEDLLMNQETMVLYFHGHTGSPYDIHSMGNLYIDDEMKTGLFFHETFGNDINILLSKADDFFKSAQDGGYDSPIIIVIENLRLETTEASSAIYKKLKALASQWNTHIFCSLLIEPDLYLDAIKEQFVLCEYIDNGLFLSENNSSKANNSNLEMYVVKSKSGNIGVVSLFISTWKKTIHIPVGKIIEKHKGKTYDVPSRVDVDLESGESKTTYVTLSEDEYNNYEDQIIKPFAQSVYEQIIKDIASDKQQ